MIAIQANDLGKSFGDRQILAGITLSISEKERVGMVGPNGSGKSTLIKCLTGQLTPDTGKVLFASGTSLGYLEQLTEQAPDTTAWDIVMEAFAEILEQRKLLHTLEQEMARGGEHLPRVMDRYAAVTESYERANGYACEAIARRILVGLGFKNQQFEQTWQTFSGGEKTRLTLARLLARKPDLLLLDEPTNHLDIASREWLESFLCDYPGTVLVVSHDRRFLDRIATRIVELCGGELRSYPGNYSQYLKLKAEYELTARRAYEKQQEQIARTEAYIQRFRAGIKSRQARGRQSQLDRLERLEAPPTRNTIKIPGVKISHPGGTEVWNARGLTKSFAERNILQDIDISIRKGERLALVGPNGSGKTTLIKIMVGQIPADAGEAQLGARVKIGYFSQGTEDLAAEGSVLDEIIETFDITMARARDLLARVMFRGDDVFKTVDCLSGGERVRLSLLKLVLSGANFLVLDEPTNHLDIESLRAVEDMLKEYEGTLLVVSHDRYFLDELATGILALEDCKVKYYSGNYSEYYEKVSAAKSLEEAEIRTARQEQARRNPQEQIQKEKARFKKKLLSEIGEIEARISELEEEKSQLEALLSVPETYNEENQARLYTSRFKEVDSCLQEAYQQWENLMETLDTGT